MGKGRVCPGTGADLICWIAPNESGDDPCARLALDSVATLTGGDKGGLLGNTVFLVSLLALLFGTAVGVVGCGLNWCLYATRYLDEEGQPRAGGGRREQELSGKV